MEDSPNAAISRRHLLLGGAVSTAGMVIPSSVESQAPSAPSSKPPSTSQPAPVAAQSEGIVSVTLQVNGQVRSFSADVRTTLLDALREKVGLSGTKKGCDHGQCGACTVHIAGKRVLSCLTLAVSAQGKPLTTIEGLAPANGTLHPMQQAFIDHDAFQCGYCTPGQIMSAVAMINEGHANNDAEIREYMSGNLCRCAAYPNIVAAVNQAKTQIAKA